MEGGQHYDRLESLKHSLTKVLPQVCAKPPPQGSQPFAWTQWNNRKKTLKWTRTLVCVCSIFWKIQAMVVCMQYALPYEWNMWTKFATLFWRSKVLPLWINVMQKKWEGGWTSSKDVLHLSTHCTFLQEYSFLFEVKEISCFQGNYFEEVKSFLKTWSCEKNVRGRNSIKGCI